MNLNKRLIFLWFALVFVIPFDINAHAPGIPPEMLNEYKNMSPAEQRRLAQQYDIDIGVADGAEGAEGNIAGAVSLGNHGGPLAEYFTRGLQAQPLGDKGLVALACLHELADCLIDLGLVQLNGKEGLLQFPNHHVALRAEADFFKIFI